MEDKSVVSDSSSDSSDDSKDKNIYVLQEKPKCSEDFMNRFKALAKRTDDVTRQSTQTRIKHLQRHVMDKVQTEITMPEDRDILHEHDVKFGPPVDRPTLHHRKRKLPVDTDCESSKNKDCKTEWLQIKPFLTANDHLKGTDPGKYGPKTILEEKIDKAISVGNFDRAEHLSDHLSTRDFGKKIADAINAKEYSKKKEAEKETAKAKKKKLPWGFQQKQRWETKSNM